MALDHLEGKRPWYSSLESEEPMPTGAIQVLDTINDDREVTYFRGTEGDFRREVEKRSSGRTLSRGEIEAGDNVATSGHPDWIVASANDKAVMAYRRGSNRKHAQVKFTWDGSGYTAGAGELGRGTTGRGPWKGQTLRETSRSSGQEGEQRYVVQYLVDNEIVADNQAIDGSIRVFDERAMQSGRRANPKKAQGFTGKGRGGPPTQIHKMRWKPDRYTVEQIVEDLRGSDPDLSHTFNIARDLPVYEWGEGNIDWEDPDLNLTEDSLYPIPHEIMVERMYDGEDADYSTWISNHVDMKEVEALLRDYGFIQVESAYTGERDTWVLPRTLREGTGRWPQSWSDLEGNPEDSPPVDTSKLEV